MQRINRASRSLEPADVVDDRERADVVEERVDGEVAPEGVLFRRAVGVVALNQAVVRRAAAAGARASLLGVGPFLVGLGRRCVVAAGTIGAGLERFGDFGLGGQFRRIDLPPEGRDLDRLRAELDVREAEAAADDPAVAKQLLDLVRMRRRADVEILRPPVQQQVADAAADQVRDVVVFVQPIQDFERAGIDVAARNGVRGAWDDGRLRHRTAV